MWAYRVITVLAVAALGAVLWSNRSRLHPLTEVPLDAVLLVTALVVAAHWLNAFEFWFLFRAVGAPVGVTENWMLFTAGQLVNSLPAQAGTLYRLRYLRSVHDLSYSRASAAYGANLVLTVMATALLGAIGTVVVGVTEDNWSPILLVLFAGMIVGALATRIVPLPQTQRTGRVARAWTDFSAGWAELRQRQRLAAGILGIEALKYVLAAFRLQLTFGWLGYHEPYIFFLVLAPVIGLASFIGLTPAAIGIREVAISGAAVALGRRFSEGILGATLDRAVLFLVTLLLGSVGLALSERRVRRVEGPATDNAR